MIFRDGSECEKEREESRSLLVIAQIILGQGYPETHQSRDSLQRNIPIWGTVSEAPSIFWNSDVWRHSELKTPEKKK